MGSSGLRSTSATKLVALACALCLNAGNGQIAFAQSNTITVQVDRPGATIAPTLFGLFFEDINFAADGGIYPERLKNRSFEFPEPLMGWKPVERGGAKGALNVINQDSENDAPNQRFLRINVETEGGGFGVMNDGFRGIGVEQGAEYSFSVRARRADGAGNSLRIELEDADGRALGASTISGITPEWKQFTVIIRPTATSAKARFNILATGRGAVDVDALSLFPKGTWKNRQNGLRSDLVQLLKDMKPGFLRFPGGCIVEGRTLESRYQWKTTVGDLDDRQLIVNRWNTEFKHRPAPDYYQSFGLGFYEYFQLSEDVGAEPLPILNCGMACQFNTGELAAVEDLDHYIQDALDLVEFANAPVTTAWGRKRAAMGHPAPFNLKMIGVGNEQWGPQYIERYKVFSKVLKEKYPEIKLISSAGPSPNDERFKFLWNELRALKADIVDEHYYMEPKWFRENVNRYDDYPRDGPKVFAGEYAAQSVGVARPDNRNNWEGALSEAAFMTGLERNADLVVMASYAPLFAHVDAWQWTPNMIWFDNLRSFGTPNYYVQKMFGANVGTNILPVLLNGAAKNGQAELYASASYDK
ncbi:MAG: alpha-L-arabinofuranosidase C-terminal domain-containing protein, partial [Pyrinomonadaceae bacterium]